VIPSITSWALLALLVMCEIRSYYERKRLMDRIMSRDLNELRAWEQNVRKPVKNKDRNIVRL